MNSHPYLSEELSNALDQFRTADWTFADAKTNAGLHGIHPYPAKFVPQVPRQLLKLFHPIVRAPVLDPFCGSGTTLVECRAMGIPSFGIDLNPIATLVSKVKTDPPDSDIVRVATQITETASVTIGDKCPDIPRLDHWFAPGAVTALTKLTRLLAEISDQRTRNALHVALSRIIVRVSRQESDTRYAAVDHPIEEGDVYELFLDSALTLDNAFRIEHSNLFHKPVECGVLTKDVLTVLPNDLPYKFGLIITSPPYPNAYEYWLYHKYRMYWLGEDPIAVRNAEIGARPNYFKRNPATADDFRKQMAHCFELFREVTLPRAVICIVVGRSIIKGKVINNAALLRSAAHEHNFQHVGSAARKIPSTRKAFNPAHGTINAETIIVFARNDL